MAILTLYDGGGFPFLGLAGFVPVSRAPTQWVLQEASSGRWLVVTGAGLPTAVALGFPNAGTVTGLALSTVQAPANDGERVFTLSGLATPAGVLAPFAANPAAPLATLSALLLAGNDVIDAAPVDVTPDARDGPVTLDAGAGNDSVAGTGFADLLLGGAGNDTISGRVGHDTVVAGDGNDRLFGDAGADRLQGEAGNDTLLGGAGTDRLFGGAGNDSLVGGLGRDILDGGGGDDTVVMDAAPDATGEVLRGGAGTDVLVLPTQAWLQHAAEITGFEELRIAGPGGLILLPSQWTQFLTVRAAAPTDIAITMAAPGLLGLGLADWDGVAVYSVTGSAGDDTVLGLGVGAILAPGPSGDTDRLLLGAGNDAGFGDTGNDTLFGQSGADSLYGEEGDDSLDGGDGRDDLTGGEGRDALSGGADSDTLWGGDGNDTLLGGDGSDAISGEAGDDLLDGGAGADSLYGGAGNDTFLVSSPTDSVYEQPGEGIDVIRIDGPPSGPSITAWQLAAAFEHLDVLLSTAVALTGNAAANRITGGEGADTIDAAGGNDTLLGGAGTDLLTGGAGRDRFVWTLAAHAPLAGDTVTDFDADPFLGQDIIDLSGIDAVSGTILPNEKFAWSGTTPFSGAGQARIQFVSGTTWQVLLNTDADLAADARIVVTLAAGTLDLSDFVL